MQNEDGERGFSCVIESQDALPGGMSTSLWGAAKRRKIVGVIDE
jgi:hypothetical protein